ncbi:hypothetical protein [uncultured Acinetobacter sp.]|uniref:hypothetical protein n=1 Tax=uncultured Acinetobacter sp. TaxID=165433 RepID=UPI0025DD6D17|nr:hypothetical protein [uncultured Acinetobacter sp.]
MVLKAPQRLTLTYSVDATQGPSGIYKPEQLTLTPLFTFIRPDSFDANEFGRTRTSPSQIVVPSGLLSSEFGNTHTYNDKQFLSVSGVDTSNVGATRIWNLNQYVSTIGPNTFTSSNEHKVFNLHSYLEISGFVASVFGTYYIRTLNRQYNIPSFVATTYGRPLIYNLRQYAVVSGHNMAIYGTAYAQGGVKEVRVLGFNSAVLPQPKLINTRADQYVDLRSPSRGIAPLSIDRPNVSPRIIYTIGILPIGFGIALVQRNPSPRGFTNDSYGNTWISHSPRYLKPNYIDAFNSGYPKIFDPTQRIGVTGANTVIPGGVFGDISIRNTRRIIKLSGLYAQSFSDWGVIESNLRNIIPKGLDNQNFGSNAIRNKTPSIAPIGINSFAGLNSAIGYRIRTIKPSGFYQPKFGQPTLTKTPELKPSGNNQNIFGSTWISHKTRSIYAGLGRESLLFGEINVWHFTRVLKPIGIFNDQYGIPRIEHGRRVLLAKGSIHSAYGNDTWLSYAVRFIAPLVIDYPKIPNHRVGGTQNIQPFGYVATLFGSRIIPESQSIYPQGFINPFGITMVDLWKKYIKPNGFLTTGQEGGHRFGTHKFWNLRQYIVQFYDGDSGLVPPKWTGWTSIENKNKSIGAIGNNLARIGEPNIENKARLLSANGLNALVFGQAMIADRIRKLKLQGMESPYMSSWSVIYNAAPVIAQKGFKADSFGIGTILNTRRYFNRIGNFESLEMGKPLVADRIRTLKFEQRYTIAPPYIPIHRIDLHTRYIEEVGRFDDHQAFGNPSLSIHWNLITPRWTMRDAYGTPKIKNLTPDLGTRGRNSEEFGQASIRTQWRDLLHLGSETVVWGRSEVAFRDRQFSVSGFTQWAIPKHTVIKTGVPPYYPQYIWLDAVELDGEQNNGHGIKIPERQVSDPSVKSNVIFPEGFIASRYGNHYTQSNGILVQPGLQELTVGSHLLTLKNRKIIVPTMGDFLQIKEVKPRISPWTIWATEDTPSQAITNHPESNRFHPINSSGGTRPAGEVFGNLNITLQHRKFSIGIGNQSSFGNGHKIDLRRRYINLKDFGFRSQRIGFHVVGPFDQNIIQFDSNDMQNFGQPSLSIPYGGAFFIKPNGLNSPILNRPTVDFFNRTIKTVGSNHLQMGTWKSGDTPFMWQGLRVGELVKGNYGGFDSQQFGQTWISLKVRELKLDGFDSFVCEYDYTAFDQRMRVRLTEIPKPVQGIQCVGFDAFNQGVPNIKPAVHYIRPDGNADQFRKGAF